MTGSYRTYYVNQKTGRMKAKSGGKALKPEGQLIRRQAHQPSSCKG